MSELIQQEIKGFSVRNLWRMKQFYETYFEEKILSTLWTQLSWSHNRRIMTLKTEEEREFYLNNFPNLGKLME